MLAGSILIFGAAGIRAGAGMRRGTIGLLGPEPAPPMLPTFKFACAYRPEFLRVFLWHLRRSGFAVPEECLTAVYRRYNGDFLELGKGEILVRA
jgi:formylmethanofuran dehydrogenase subunit C